MIWFAASDADFDLDMEVLACIPRSPSYATLADLCEDFGFAKQEQAREILKRLALPYGLAFGNRGEGKTKQHGVSVVAAAWSHANAAVEAYWTRVYGETKQVA